MTSTQDYIRNEAKEAGVPAVTILAKKGKKACAKFMVDVCAFSKELLLPLYYRRLLPDGTSIQGSGECKAIFAIPQPDGLNVLILTLGDHILAIKEQENGVKQLWKTCVKGAQMTRLCPQLKRVLVKTDTKIYSVNVCSGTVSPNPKELPRQITQLQLLGDMAVAGDGDGNVKTWNYQTGEEKAPVKLPSWILQLQLLGDMAVAADGDGNIKTWNYQTGEEKAPVKLPCRIFQLQLLGDMAVAGDDDGNVKTWNYQTGEGNVPVKLPYGITQLQLLGEMAVAGDAGGNVKTWNYQTGEASFFDRFFFDFGAVKLPYGIYQLQLLGDMAVAGDYRGNVKTWNYQTGEEKTPVKLTGRIVQLQLLDDMAVAGDNYGNVKTWNYQTGEEKAPVKMPHGITQLQLLGEMVVAGDYEGNIQTWNYQTGEEKTLVKRPGIIHQVQLVGEMAVAVDQRGNVKTWNYQTGEEKAPVKLPYFITQLQLLGDMAVAGDERGNIKTWNYQTGEEKTPVTLPYGTASFQLQLLDDMAVAGDGDGNIKTWNYQTGEEKAPVKLPYWITQLQLLGEIAVAGDGHGNVKTWNHRTGEEKTIVKLPYGICQLQLLGDMAVAGDGEGNVKTWNYQTGEEKAPVKLPDRITQLQLLGEMAVAVDECCNVKTWNYQTGEEKTPVTLPWDITQLQLLGEMAVAGDKDGNIKTWNYQTGNDAGNPKLLNLESMVYKGLHINRSGGIAKAMLGAIEVATLDEGLAPESCQISKIGVACMKTTNGILCWDLELLSSSGVMAYGLSGKEYYEAKHWVNLFLPPAWILYLLSTLSMLATSGQMLGFSETLPQAPTTKRIIDKLMFFQNIGLPDFSDFPDIFMWIFWFDAFLCAVYVLSGLVFISMLERLYWAKPESTFFNIRELLLLYTQVVSSVGIVPMFKMLLRAIPCDAKGDVVKEDSSVQCHSLEHVMCMATAISLGVLAAVVTYHMASVGFSAKAMHIELNIFDTSRHDLPPQRAYRHPFSLNDYAYDKAVVLVKIGLCTANISMKKPTTHASINLAGMALLLLLGMRYNKYFPYQREKGRFLEPNYVVTAIDAGTTWYFMLILISSILTDSGQDLFNNYKPLLNALANITPLVALMAYIARSRKQSCSSYLATFLAYFDHHTPQSEHEAPLLQNRDR